MRSLLRRLRGDASGAALVEFALVVPLLLTMVLGMIEFGRIWNVRQVITDATREGARVAVVNNQRVAQAELERRVRTAIRARLASAALDTVPPRLAITWTNVGALPATTATINVQYNYPMMFGGFVLGRNTLTLRSTFAMRNE